MDLWLQVLEKIKLKISQPRYETWFSGTYVEIEDDVMTVISESKFASNWLEAKYKTFIFETVREVANQTYEIEFISHEELDFNDRVANIDTMKNLIDEQSELIKKQQDKMIELESRVQQLETKVLRETMKNTAD